MEPYRLRHWKAGSAPNIFKFHTCARPGRSKGANGKVPRELLRKWRLGLPGPERSKIAIISLLGRKQGPDGCSEYSFYPFYGGFDTQRGKDPSFQKWLSQQGDSRSFLIHEHPTYDFKPIPKETLDSVVTDIRELASRGYIVTVVDSGGETRTKSVCEHMGATETFE